MWNRPWKYKEGAIVGAGLFVTGLVLQLCVGRIYWQVLAWPVNLFVLVFILTALAVMFAFRKRIYFLEWCSHAPAAVSSLAWVAAVTVAMGLIRQESASVTASDTGFLSRMLSAWPFVLLYGWLVMVLGLSTLRGCLSFTPRKIPFLLNHAGLFLVLVAATLGSADMQRLRMVTQTGFPEWRAENEENTLVELPLAIELKDFTIDEYPPKLVLVDNGTGKALPENNPEHLLLEEEMTDGCLLDWQITVRESLPVAAPVTAEGTKFTGFHSPGAAYAVYLRAVHKGNGREAEGWVSCGSYLFPYKALRLDSLASIVMPEREPQRFVSKVVVYTQSGKQLEKEIEVNRPLRIEGWCIYQLDYDKAMGRWSRTSVFELVKDPWLPLVYTGIVLMAAGAVCLFVNVRTKKEEESV